MSDRAVLTPMMVDPGYPNPRPQAGEMVRLSLPLADHRVL